MTLSSWSTLPLSPWLGPPVVDAMLVVVDTLLVYESTFEVEKEGIFAKGTKASLPQASS